MEIEDLIYSPINLSTPLSPQKGDVIWDSYYSNGVITSEYTTIAGVFVTGTWVMGACTINISYSVNELIWDNAKKAWKKK